MFNKPTYEVFDPKDGAARFMTRWRFAAKLFAKLHRLDWARVGEGWA